MEKINRSKLSTSTCRPGHITRKPYLNFCREFRMKHNSKPAVQQIREAARMWHTLNPQDKTKYILQALYARKILKKQSPARRNSRKSAAIAKRKRRNQTARRRRRS